MSAAEPVIPPEPTPIPEPTPAAPLAAMPDWKAGLAAMPEGLRGNPLFEQYGGDTPRGFQGIMEDYLGVQRLIAGEKVVVPTDDATPEDYTRFYNALGRPGEASGYDLSAFTAPEGIGWDEGLQGVMIDKLWAAGLSQDQMMSTVTGFAEAQAERAEAVYTSAVEAHNAADTALHEKWGTEYDAKLEGARRAFNATFGDLAPEIGNIPLPDGTLFSDHPAVVEGFANLFGKIGEDHLVGGLGNPANAWMPEVARQKIAEIESNPEQRKILTNTGHEDREERAALQRTLDALYAAAYPE